MEQTYRVIRCLNIFRKGDTEVSIAYNGEDSDLWSSELYR